MSVLTSQRKKPVAIKANNRQRFINSKTSMNEWIAIQKNAQLLKKNNAISFSDFINNKVVK